MKQRVLITGAAGGLGTAVMAQLTAAGADVLGLDIRDVGRADVRVCDVRDAAAVKEAVDWAVQRLGGLDILINNAGVLSLQDATATPNQDVRDAFETNLLGAWNVAAAATSPLMKSNGRIINIASLFAVVNAPFIPAYCASKRGLCALSDIMRMQFGDQIGVTTLYPGFVDTPIHEAAVRQGLSVKEVVTIKLGGKTLLSLEEPVDRAARGVVKACSGRVRRDSGVTAMGSLSLMAARHAPRVVDWFVRWRLRSLTKQGMNVQLEST